MFYDLCHRVFRFGTLSVSTCSFPCKETCTARTSLQPPPSCQPLLESELLCHRIMCIGCVGVAFHMQQKGREKTQWATLWPLVGFGGTSCASSFAFSATQMVVTLRYKIPTLLIYGQGAMRQNQEVGFVEPVRTYKQMAMLATTRKIKHKCGRVHRKPKYFSDVPTNMAPCHCEPKETNQTEHKLQTQQKSPQVMAYASYEEPRPLDVWLFIVVVHDTARRSISTTPTRVRCCPTRIG